CASSPADGTEAAVWTSPREAPKCAPREVFRAPSRPQEACGGPLLTLPAAAQPRHAECATTPYLLLQFCKTLPAGLTPWRDREWARSTMGGAGGYPMAFIGCRPYAFANALRTTSGAAAMTLRYARAAWSGSARPCSQSRSVP